MLLLFAYAERRDACFMLLVKLLGVGFFQAWVGWTDVAAHPTCFARDGVSRRVKGRWVDLL